MENDTDCPTCNKPFSEAQACPAPQCEGRAHLLRTEPYAGVLFAQNFLLPEPGANKKYVIWDLDGVICRFSDLRKILYYQKDYDQVNAMGVQEPLLRINMDRVKALSFLGIESFICTSREGKYISNTIHQISAGNIDSLPFRAILMRGEGDHKSSSLQLKPAMHKLIQTIFPTWECIAAVDDRGDVIDKYNDIGVPGVFFSEQQHRSNT